MPENWEQGLIFLIPKKSEGLDNLTNWRPITLLNTIYKIYAKALASRLHSFLDQIIYSSQSGFMQNHSIFDNIFIFREAVDLAQRSEMDLAILLLDFENVYDRVDWNFLHGTLLRMGFQKINGFL